MQAVDFISDVAHTTGTIGYSVLYKNWDGAADRKTVLFLRGLDGFTETVLIVAADAVRGAF
jgi:hypothetical protein